MNDTTLAAKRFIIGIDLGTTNSAVSYVDLSAPSAAIEIFNVPQLTAPGEFRRLPVLPSFLYIPGQYDIDGAAITHPWPKVEDDFAGALARDQGAQVPGRLVSSAKSWLCHGNVDRNARILPWGAPQEVHKVSPVQAGAAYLGHIRRAWNYSRGDEEELFLENQNVVLTVPASFDEVARELTLAAAKLAGYRHVTLLEEPLAAFYSWLVRHERQWDDFVRPNELILICDVGGGTTDFTLVTLNAVEGGSPRFERIAVGDHLILGGDNIDLALARRVEAQWSAGRRPTLDTNRWKSLTHQCRQAKEHILSGEADHHRITLMGGGSRLIAGTVTAELDRTTIEQTILEGFFPLIDSDAVDPPAQRAAITEFGLPYEPEPRITRHMIRFLERHRQDVAGILGKAAPMPDLVLFNGGALKPESIQTRIIDALCHYYAPTASDRPRVLENRNHDLAVALGAAYYGLVKIGRGVRVGSGSPRAYYLGVDLPGQMTPERRQAICLVERGLDEGSVIELGDKTFEVLANQPVRFDLFSSTYRSRDRSGEMVTVDDSFMPLPPLQTVIQFGKKRVKTAIPVRIQAEYTEMGTLALWCRSLVSEHRWQLQFQLRDSAQPIEVREEVVLDADLVRQARQAMQAALAGTGPNSLDGLVKQIATIVDRPREQWPLSLIRELADALLAERDVRARTAQHEARWLNLTGFFLRPGFGDSLDPERIKQTWKVYTQGAVRPNHAQVQVEWWIMWRRVAGGLTPGQQRQLSQELGTLLQPKKGKKVRLPQQLQLEIWMAVANFERLYTKDKIQWGRLLLAQLAPNQTRPQYFWALARIGARELLYGPADRVIPPQEAAQWIALLLNQSWPNPKWIGAALAQLARKTGDRTRDVAPALTARILAWMDQYPELSDQQRYLTEVVPIARQEEQVLFGESLPSGIVLRVD
ncbi:MAG: molecular chaperone DnaK [Desulfatitalea sp. BRH_c12]|nr:MAG: molecular chaperone DnaK [Desulfatitalea sp. BRH_c12]